jgi:hypothetical protein
LAQGRHRLDAGGATRRQPAGEQGDGRQEERHLCWSRRSSASAAAIGEWLMKSPGSEL